jgi:hypothetical protein
MARMVVGGLCYRLTGRLWRRFRRARWRGANFGKVWLSRWSSKIWRGGYKIWVSKWVSDKFPYVARGLINFSVLLQHNIPCSCPRTESRCKLNYLFIEKRGTRVHVVVLLNPRINLTPRNHERMRRSLPGHFPIGEDTPPTSSTFRNYIFFLVFGKDFIYIIRISGISLFPAAEAFS